MNSVGYTVGVRLQKAASGRQALVLARFAQARSKEGQFTPKQLDTLFCDFALPTPSNVSQIIAKLRKEKLLTRGTIKGTWKLTPLGKQTSIAVFSDLDLTTFCAEAVTSSSILGNIAHTVVPPHLAPPGLIVGLQKFLAKHPFETNVFGMTRFPENGAIKRDEDRLNIVLGIARETCRLHGLEFHLASDRAIIDDLWTNTAAHMWASQYGIGFFENRAGEGLNYNLTIEVGGMLMTGRRCALLKDRSIKSMPTDLVGQIYKDVDFEKIETIKAALHTWIRNDLNLGRCSECPKTQ